VRLKDLDLHKNRTAKDTKQDMWLWAVATALLIFGILCLGIGACAGIVWVSRQKLDECKESYVLPMTRQYVPPAPAPAPAKQPRKKKKKHRDRHVHQEPVYYEEQPQQEYYEEYQEDLEQQPYYVNNYAIQHQR
jgi:Zn-finger nucleic acid-binding protein